MTQNGAWSLTGMSTLLGRDTTAGQQAWKHRRLESEQQSAADLARRRNLCAVLAVVIHDLETDRASVWRRNRLDWDKYLREMRHNLWPLPFYVQDVACMFSQHFRHNREIHGARRQSERKSRSLHFSEHAARYVPAVSDGGLVSGHPWQIWRQQILLLSCGWSLWITPVGSSSVGATCPVTFPTETVDWSDWVNRWVRSVSNSSSSKPIGTLPFPE